MSSLCIYAGSIWHSLPHYSTSTKPPCAVLVVPLKHFFSFETISVFVYFSQALVSIASWPRYAAKSL